MIFEFLHYFCFLGIKIGVNVLLNKSKINKKNWLKLSTTVLSISRIVFVLFRWVIAAEKEQKYYLPSISSMFYACIFCTKFWCKKLQSWNLTWGSFAICFCTKKVRIKRWWNWHLQFWGWSNSLGGQYSLKLPSLRHFPGFPSEERSRVIA